MYFLIFIFVVLIIIQIGGSLIAAFLLLIEADISQTFIKMFSCNEPSTLLRRYAMLFLITPVYLFCYLCITRSKKLKQKENELCSECQTAIVLKGEREN